MSNITSSLILTPTQRRAYDDYKARIAIDYAMTTQCIRSRGFKKFLQHSTWLASSYTSLDEEILEQSFIDRFVREYSKHHTGPNLDDHLAMVESALRVIKPDQDIDLHAQRRCRIGSKPCRNVVAVPIEAIRGTLDGDFVESIRATTLGHREFMARTLMGLIAQAAPELAELPLRDRFSEENLGPRLPDVMAPLMRSGEIDKAHLIADELNRFFKTEEFGWLKRTLRALSLAKGRNKTRSNQRAPRPSDRVWLTASDMRREPYASIMDKAAPTLATPIERAGRASIVKPTSRRLLDIDLMHLFNAMHMAGIKTNHNDVAALFTTESIDALVSYLMNRMSNRNIGRTIKRLRLIYWRLFQNQHAEIYRYMLMIGRLVFSSSPRKRRIVDHLDFNDISLTLDEELDRVSSLIKHIQRPPNFSEIIEFRSLLIMAILLTTGLRLSNVARLRRSQIMSVSGTTVVDIDAHEVKNGVRLTLVLPPWLVKYLDHYLDLPYIKELNRDWVWVSKLGNPISFDSARWQVKFYSLHLIGETLTPHDFRRLLSSHLQRTPGVDQSKVYIQMGHIIDLTTYNDYPTYVRPDFLGVLMKTVPTLSMTQH